jgi:hypothetical protein
VMESTVQDISEKHGFQHRPLVRFIPGVQFRGGNPVTIKQFRGSNILAARYRTSHGITSSLS